METLVLNKSYLPVSIITSYEALSGIYCGRFNPIEYYDVEIYTINDVYYHPSVVQSYSKEYVPRRPAFSNKTVYIRDGYECAYCLSRFPEWKLTIDHVVPKSRGGKHTFNNVVACCCECNQEKGDWLCDELGMWPQKKACTPLWPCLNEIPMQWRDYLI